MDSPEDNSTDRGYGIFDLDHNLLPFDTQALFCNFVLRQEPWRVVYLLWFAACLPFFLVKLVDLHWMKRLFCSYLWRMKRARLETLARRFADDVIPAVVYSEVVAELERHRKEGRHTILNSASPSFYVGEVARVLGFDDWVSTRVPVAERMPFLPEIEGRNNKGTVKLELMRPLLPEGFSPETGEQLPDSWAYSDHHTDEPLLACCEHGVMVHPTEKLAAIGAERGWETMLPPRPYEGKAGDRWARVRQICGLYPLPRLAQSEAVSSSGDTEKSVGE